MDTTEIERQIAEHLHARIHLHQTKVAGFKRLMADKIGAHLYAYVLHLIGSRLGNADDLEAIFQALGETDERFANYANNYVRG